MNRTFVLIALIGASYAGTLSAGNFATDFQEAKRLYIAGKLEEAEAAFVELANGAHRSPRPTDAALEMASLCALRRKDFDEALKRAEHVKEEPARTLCKMRILEAQKAWAAIIKLAGAEDFETWPDRLIYDAAMGRGKAHAIVGNAAAEADFLLARRATFDTRERAFANLSLGNLYRDRLHDEDKALKAYHNVTDSTVLGATKFEGVIAYGRLLAQRDKGQDALAELDKLEVDAIPSPHWRCRIYEAYGDVYAAMGRTADAVASFRKAIQVPEATESFIETTEKKIAAMAP